jgi:hypothetical protein
MSSKRSRWPQGSDHLGIVNPGSRADQAHGSKGRSAGGMLHLDPRAPDPLPTRRVDGDGMISQPQACSGACRSGRARFCARAATQRGASRAQRRRCHAASAVTVLRRTAWVHCRLAIEIRYPMFMVLRARIMRWLGVGARWRCRAVLENRSGVFDTRPFAVCLLVDQLWWGPG